MKNKKIGKVLIVGAIILGLILVFGSDLPFYADVYNGIVYHNLLGSVRSYEDNVITRIAYDLPDSENVNGINYFSESDKGVKFICDQGEPFVLYTNPGTSHEFAGRNKDYCTRTSCGTPLTYTPGEPIYFIPEDTTTGFGIVCRHNEVHVGVYFGGTYKSVECATDSDCYSNPFTAFFVMDTGEQEQTTTTDETETSNSNELCVNFVCQTPEVNSGEENSEESSGFASNIIKFVIGIGVSALIVAGLITFAFLRRKKKK